MKVKVDEQEIFELAEWEKDVIKNDIDAADFDSDMKRRLEWVLRHKAEQCYIRFEKEWLEKLRADPTVASIPTSKEAFVALVRSRADYKDRAARNIEAKAAMDAQIAQGVIQ
jgi:hypothetical protein